MPEFPVDWRPPQFDTRGRGSFCKSFSGPLLTDVVQPSDEFLQILSDTLLQVRKHQANLSDSDGARVSVGLDYSGNNIAVHYCAFLMEDHEPVVLRLGHKLFSRSLRMSPRCNSLALASKTLTPIERNFSKDARLRRVELPELLQLIRIAGKNVSRGC